MALAPVPDLDLITPFRRGGATSCTLRPIRHSCWKDCAAVATYDHHSLGSKSATMVMVASGLLPFAP